MHPHIYVSRQQMSGYIWKTKGKYLHIIITKGLFIFIHLCIHNTNSDILVVQYILYNIHISSIVHIGK